MKSGERPDVARELSRLKDFQRATVEHVHRRFWVDEDYTRRFLVADEVGLGKTMVARGVIARTVDHLWEREARIDVVYICSNSQIARQNLSRLNIGGYSVDHADRLTLLPTVITDLRRNHVNFVSFTPGTSFHIKESGGKAAERLLLQWMLAKAWGRELIQSRGWLKFFRGGVTLDGYETALKGYDHQRIDLALAQQFAQDVESSTSYTGALLTEDLDSCVDRFRWLRGNPDYGLSRHRYRLIGQMRNLVAKAAVESLEPDLVILDEFQRFKDLLDPKQPGADLAHAIFDQPTARVLLLSATPYKMYTLPDEPEGDDHYADFRSTVEFLAGEERGRTVTRDLRTMRDALLGSRDRVVAEEAKGRVEGELRRVMSRTERLAASPDRDGMLCPASLKGVRMTASDVRGYASAARIAQCVGGQDVFEYWRSSPYMFNIMEDYHVKRQLRSALAKADVNLLDELRNAWGLLDWQALKEYRELDPGNAKMRGLVHDVLDRGAWQLLWLPPSLPYYSPRGAYAEPDLQSFTKRLVFSAWAVVPKAIALVLSYEAERRARSAAGAITRAYDEERTTALLRFQVDEQRATGMPVLAILYPSTALARLGDPLVLARRVADHLPADRDSVEREARRAVGEALNALPGGQDGTLVDQRWYWAAPFLLDADALGGLQRSFIDRMISWGDGDEDAQTRLVDHVREAAAIDRSTLGRRPDDLVEVLTQMALAAPGPVALRSLTRVCGGEEAASDVELRDAAAYISWGLRSLFNRPEAMAVLRVDEGSREAYWRTVVAHCADGNLQAVLDEYLHVLVESEGLQDSTGHVRSTALGRVVEEALKLRATRATVDVITVDDDGVALEPHNARIHFAARFGRNPTEDASVQREGQLRVAFNSPFWPFVLASTSVGQEGLDFHVYSHAVVHWNVPSNPVDLEQREGRVHRYKGHAIRRNVAQRYAEAAYHATTDDPWYAMFLAAVEARGNQGDLCPFWVFAPEGGVKIERYVPAMPLSKESARYERVLRTVGAYRLVIGQPRQEDLLRYVGGNPEDYDWLRIDLSLPSLTTQ